MRAKQLSRAAALAAFFALGASCVSPVMAEPEKATDKPLEKAPAATTRPAAPKSDLKVGQAVYAKWRGASYWKATVMKVRGKIITLKWDTGETEDVMLADVSPLLKQGLRVQWGGFRPGNGTVIEDHGNAVLVTNSSGQRTLVQRGDLKLKPLTAGKSSEKEEEEEQAEDEGDAKPGRYRRGQTITYHWGSSDYTTTVISDNGGPTVAVVDVGGGTYNAPRGDIKTKPTPAKPKVKDPSLTAPDTSEMEMLNLTPQGPGPAAPKAKTKMVIGAPGSGGSGPGAIVADPTVKDFQLDIAGSDVIVGAEVEGVFLAQGAPFAAVVYSKDSKTIVQRVDLGAGKAMAPVVLPEPGHVMDVSPDGTQVITVKDSVLTVWSLKEAVPKSVIKFEPLEDQSEFDPENDKAFFVGNDRIVTGDSLYVSLWRVSGAKQVWLHKLDGRGAWSASPDHSLIAIPDKFRRTQIVDIAQAACLSVVTSFGENAMFTPDGKKVITAFGNVLSFTSVKADEPATTVALQDGVTMPCVPLESDFYLLDNRYVVSTVAGVVVWRYDDLEGAISDSQGRFWKVRVTGGHPSLSWARPVTPAVREAAAKVLPADAFDFKRGDRVAIKINMPDGPGDAPAKVRESFEKQLAANGQVVADDGTITLEVVSQPGAATTYKGRNFRTGEVSEAPIKPVSHKVTLSNGKKVIWQGGSSYGDPGFIQLEANQSLGDYLEKGRINSYLGVASMHIPATIPRSLQEVRFSGSNLFGK